MANRALTAFKYVTLFLILGLLIGNSIYLGQIGFTDQPVGGLSPTAALALFGVNVLLAVVLAVYITFALWPRAPEIRVAQAKVRTREAGEMQQDVEEQAARDIERRRRAREVARTRRDIMERQRERLRQLGPGQARAAAALRESRRARVEGAAAAREARRIARDIRV